MVTEDNPKLMESPLEMTAMAGMPNGTDRKTLLIVAHAPSVNTQRMLDAVAQAACSFPSDRVEVVVKYPLQCGADDVLGASAIILGTPENLAYMSGALKDFFDRIYYPCLERTQGLPYALFIRAGQSVGAASRRAVESVVTGLRWRAVQEPVICCGPFSEEFIQRCDELGQVMAAALDAGIL